MRERDLRTRTAVEECLKAIFLLEIHDETATMTSLA